MSTIVSYPVPQSLDGTEFFAAFKDGKQIAVPPALLDPVAPGQPGLSAYQMWRMAGNTGSLQDYFASLKGPAGTGLNNKGAWVSKTTYSPGDYVFDANAAGVRSMFIVQASTPFVSTTAPRLNPTAWVEFDAPAGPAGRAAGPLASDYGAVGIVDTAAIAANDDTAELQAMIDAAHATGVTLPGLPGGGIVELDPNRSYYINGTLNLGKWVTLQSRYIRDELLDHQGGNNLDKTATTYGAQPGTIVCGPNGKILRNDGSGVRRLMILGATAAAFRSTAGVNMTADTVNTLLASYANYPIAVDTVNGAAGVFADECIIAGFNLGIRHTYNERWRVSWCKFDCLNGLYSSQTYDDIRVFANHFWPFIWGHRLADGTPNANTILANYGTAINFDTGIDASRSIDGGHVFANLIYGYLGAIDLHATNGLSCYDNWIDGDVSQSNTQNTFGIRTSGNCRRTKITGNHSDSQGRCYDLQGTGVLSLGFNTSCGATYSHLRIGSQTLINGGTHLFQGPSPQYIELAPDVGLVRFNSVWFSAVNGVGIGLTDRSLPSAATRSMISLGKVTVDNPGSSWNFDERLFRSNVASSNTSDQALPTGSYTRVALTASLDGYGEWSGSTFTAKYSGWYSLAATVGFAMAAVAAGNAIVAEVRINGVEQPLGRFQTQPGGNGLHAGNIAWQGHLNAGDTVEIWAYSDTTATLTSGKACASIVAMGTC